MTIFLVTTFSPILYLTIITEDVALSSGIITGREVAPVNILFPFMSTTVTSVFSIVMTDNPPSTTLTDTSPAIASSTLENPHNINNKLNLTH
ncbi:MAG: hypothetical protein K2I25_02935 [Muribaculaceae bacterium]|nr:hypothetical protein [Muribaculaceae bacterium]